MAQPQNRYSENEHKLFGLFMLALWNRRAPVEPEVVLARRGKARAAFEIATLSVDGVSDVLCNFAGVARGMNARLSLQPPNAFTAADFEAVADFKNGTQNTGVKAVNRPRLLQLLAARGLSEEQFCGAMFADLLDPRVALQLAGYMVRVRQRKAKPHARKAAAASDEEEEEEAEEAEEEAEAEAEEVEAAASEEPAPTSAEEEGEDARAAQARRAHQLKAGLREAHALFPPHDDAPASLAATASHSGLSAAPSAAGDDATSRLLAPAQTQQGALEAALSATPSIRGMILLDEHPDLMDALAAAPSALFTCGATQQSLAALQALHGLGPAPAAAPAPASAPAPAAAAAAAAAPCGYAALAQVSSAAAPAHPYSRRLQRTLSANRARPRGSRRPSAPACVRAGPARAPLPLTRRHPSPAAQARAACRTCRCSSLPSSSSGRRRRSTPRRSCPRWLRRWRRC